MTKTLLILALMTTRLAFAESCPPGWKPVSSAETGPFCVQLKSQEDVRAIFAADVCQASAVSGARLCSSVELATACRQGGVDGLGMRWEWALSMGHYVSAAAHEDCGALAYGELLEKADLRCCLSPREKIVSD